MTAKSLLLAAGASILLTLGTFAEPDADALLPQFEVQAPEQSGRAEEKIHHLMQAAEHLGAAGLHDEAARIRERASLLRAEHEQRLAELERLHHRRTEEQRRRELEALVQNAMAQLLEKLRSESEAELAVPRNPPGPPHPDMEAARAEEQRRQVMRQWQRIKDAARGYRPPEPMADPKPPTPLPPDLPWSKPPHPAEGEQETGAPQQEVLQQILRTLQHIEKKLEQHGEAALAPPIVGLKPTLLEEQPDPTITMTGPEKADAIRQRKGSGPAIAALTAYDYPTARLLDEAGIDLLLVGDSLGMVVLGYPDTTHVTMDHMVHHTAAASRGSNRALVVTDLPINTYATPAEALSNARALAAAGAEAVKLEGGLRQAEKVRSIIDDGIPVLGHLGMLPQRVIEEGGYRKKGTSEPEVEALHAGAAALQEAGCFAIVLESVIPKAAASVTAALDIPTIGIGCGNHTCNGEIAVVTDVIGSYPWFVPPFATQRAGVAEETTRAVSEYIAACRGNSDLR